MKQKETEPVTYTKEDAISAAGKLLSNVYRKDEETIITIINAKKLAQGGNKEAIEVLLAGLKDVAGFIDMLIKAMEE